MNDTLKLIDELTGFIDSFDVKRRNPFLQILHVSTNLENNKSDNYNGGDNNGSTNSNANRIINGGDNHSANKNDNHSENGSKTNNDHNYDIARLRQEYSELAKHPNFGQGRSPFFRVDKRCCVMPVFERKRIQFRMSLSSHDLLKINSNSHKLHLRLFSISTLEHESWSTAYCDVSINNKQVNIDGNIATNINGHHIVKPLDITTYASQATDFEITSNNSLRALQ